MEQILIETAKQVPSLVVLVIVVWQFLRFMNLLSVRFTAEMALLHKEHLDARNQQREVIMDNTEAVRDLTTAVGVMQGVVKSCEVHNGKKP